MTFTGPISLQQYPTVLSLASALNEIMTATNLTLSIEESAIPVLEEVQGACELLGDPLYIANEGRFVAFVAPEDLSSLKIRCITFCQSAQSRGNDEGHNC